MENLEKEVNIVIAAGGTGGHLFPAQALAIEMLQKKPNVKITFIGSGLKTNSYFKNDLFPYLDIKSETIIKKHPIKVIKALISISKGFLHCIKFYKKKHPDLIIGFGSYHTFPVLLAGKLKKIPIMIFESNALPGRVNRFCSKWAKISAIQFSYASDYLKGKSICVQMPFFKEKENLTKKNSRKYFNLYLDKFTFLVFGGSQGAEAINRFFCEALELLLDYKLDFQVIHIVGDYQRVEKLKEVYKRYQIPSVVKSFEEKMNYAWKAADLTISRSGAATLSELIEFTMPSILIPYPFGTENHQGRNAAFIADKIKGGVVLEEKALNAQILAQVIIEMVSGDKLTLMKSALYQFKEKEKKRDLCSLVLENI